MVEWTWFVADPMQKLYGMATAMHKQCSLSVLASSMLATLTCIIAHVMHNNKSFPSLMSIEISGPSTASVVLGSWRLLRDLKVLNGLGTLMSDGLTFGEPNVQSSLDLEFTWLRYGWTNEGWYMVFQLSDRAWTDLLCKNLFDSRAQERCTSSCIFMFLHDFGNTKVREVQKVYALGNVQSSFIPYVKR